MSLEVVPNSDEYSGTWGPFYIKDYGWGSHEYVGLGPTREIAEARGRGKVMGIAHNGSVGWKDKVLSTVTKGAV